MAARPHCGKVVGIMEDNMLRKYIPWLGLAYMGVAWGLSFSVAKLATADGTTPIGIAFGSLCWPAYYCSVMSICAGAG